MAADYERKAKVRRQVSQKKPEPQQRKTLIPEFEKNSVSHLIMIPQCQFMGAPFSEPHRV
jgi:hypothetical protein